MSSGTPERLKAGVGEGGVGGRRRWPVLPGLGGRDLGQRGAHQRAGPVDVLDVQEDVGGRGEGVAAQDVALDVGTVDVGGLGAAPGQVARPLEGQVDDRLAAARHQRPAFAKVLRKRSCSAAASSPCASAAKSTSWSRSARPSRTLATVPAVVGGGEQVGVPLVDLEPVPERRAIRGARVADAVAPPAVGLVRDPLADEVEVGVEVAVEAAGEDELAGLQAVEVVLRALIDELVEDLDAREVQRVEPRERALGALRQTLDVGPHLLLVAGDDRARRSSVRRRPPRGCATRPSQMRLVVGQEALVGGLELLGALALGVGA